MKRKRIRRSRDDRGVALLSALFVMLLMSAITAGFVALVITDTKVRSLDSTRTQAFYAVHAGLEKLTADLGDLFAANVAPERRRDQRDCHHRAQHARRDLGRARWIERLPDRLPDRRRGQPAGLGHDGELGAVSGPGRSRDAVPDDRDRAPGRRHRGEPHAHPADRRDSGLPVRHLLGKRPQLLRRPRTSTSAAACTRMPTCSSRRATATP